MYLPRLSPELRVRLWALPIDRSANKPTIRPACYESNHRPIHLELNFFLLAQNNSVSNFLILQTYLSAMMSSQLVPLLAILASSSTLACLSLIRSTPCPTLVISTSETSVEFVIFFLFLQPQHLQIHFSPANFNWLLQFTLLWHLTSKSQQTSTHSKLICTRHHNTS